MEPSEDAEGGQLTTAAQLAVDLSARLDELLAAGDHTSVCTLVARRFALRSDAGDVAEMAALVSALPNEVLARHPEVFLELARACDAEARVRLRTRLLRLAEQLPISAQLKFAIEAERIADLARDGCADEVEQRVALLTPKLAAAQRGSDETFVHEARSRSSYALGRVLVWRGDPSSLAAAEDALETAAGTARALGRDEWRSQALLTLGYGVNFFRGEEVRAIARLREAIGLLPAGHPRRAGISTFLADIFVRSHIGDQAVPVLEEVRREASLTGDQRSLGYAAWIMAVLCCERGERAATLEWLAEAERHPGDWFEHATGIEFVAEAAVCAERVGEVAVADRHLEVARDRAEAAGFPDMVWFATGVINARRGEPELAVSVLTQLLDEPWPPLRDRWVVWLHLALARLRAGDEPGAVQDTERAFEAASVLVGTGRAAATREDLAEALIRLQPDVVARLAPIVASTGSPLVAALHSIRPRLRLFGGLSVQLGTGQAAVPPGRPALLLMLVAITSGPITMDAAIEELWPGVSSDLGRRRIRNVLARLRASCGELIVRNGETLALAPGTVVDVTEFELACGRVERALPSDRPALARAALALNEKPLLPEAAYAPRVSRVRDEVDRRSLELLEIVATDAERNHRVDDAVAALARKADVDPYDAATPARIAALSTRAGRPGQAAFWHQRAVSLDDD